MPIYIFFGKTGSGKSFLANYLQDNYNFFHFDGDQILTSDMKEYISKNKTFTQMMVDEYTTVLKEKIKSFLNDYQRPIIISQAMYRNKNRLEILTEFPNIQFVFINAEEQTCYQRIKSRNNWVTAEYAQKISLLFDPPSGFNFIEINNDDSENMQAIERKLYKILMA